MVKTYCGKICEECTYKDKLECSGCEGGSTGENGAFACRIAKCCKEKGHQICATCSYAESCGTLRDRGNIPSYRLKERVEEAEQKERNLKKATFLGRWTGILFWLIVPGVVASLMTMETVATMLPAVYIAGEILNILVTVFYGLILFKLSKENEHYRTSGICGLITAAVNALMVFILGGAAGGTLILTIPATVVAIYGEYHEYMGHGEVLRDIDYEMSEKWYSLWRWYIGINIALVGGIVVMLLIPVLGALVVLGATIGMVAVDVYKLVCLYRTAKVFQGYC